MLGRFKEHDTVCKLLRPSDWQMADCVSDDAVAVKPMKGAAVSAHNLPNLEKHFLKSLPLQENIASYAIKIQLRVSWPVLNTMVLINGN